MTNKLVVVINSLKVPKIKKILLYEMKLLVPNYSCLQNPWLGGYRPNILILSVLCPQLNFLNPPQPNKIPGYATDGGKTTKYISNKFVFKIFWLNTLQSCMHTWRFSTVLKTDGCCTLSWATFIQYTRTTSRFKLFFLASFQYQVQKFFVLNFPQVFLSTAFRVNSLSISHLSHKEPRQLSVYSD